jgi:carboxyl-terminal processing protease
MFSSVTTAPATYWSWLDLAWQSTLLLSAAAALNWRLRRSLAASRHACWLAAFLGLAVLPMATVLPDNWRMHLVASATHASVTPGTASHADDLPHAAMHQPAASELLLAAATGSDLDLASARLSGDPAALSTSSGNTHSPAAEPSRAGSGTDPRTLVVGTWLAGCLLALMPLLLGALSLRRLNKRSCQPADAAVVTMLDDLRREMNVRRRITVVETDRREMPMTWGVWRPHILLPREARRWTPRQQELVLRHELAHVARFDCLWQLTAQLLRAVYWFQPLAWLAVARMRDEQEHACDDRVLASTVDAADYAEQLLLIVSQSRSRRLAASWALAMGRPGQIESRLRSILAARRRVPTSRRSLVGITCAVLSIALVASLPTLHAVAADPTDETPKASATQQGDETQPTANQESAGEANQEDHHSAATDGIDDQLEQLKAVRARIKMHYVHPVDERRLTEGAINGMVRSLDDPYSQYLNPDQLSDVERQVQSQLIGIGARLESKDGQVVVTSPLPDSPALKAGIQPGDVLVSVDGVTLNAKPLDEVVKLIMGPAGSEVKIVIHRGESEQALAITRRAIVVPTVRGLSWHGEQKWDYWLDTTERIAYASIEQFAANTAAELQAVLDGLAKDGLRGLVLDLRFSPGGLLSASVDVASLFLEDAVIVSSHVGKSEQVIRSKRAAPFADLPLVVLIGRQTASSSEIVAGALQDNGRAVLLGTRTFGKGSVQTIVKLPGAGGLKVTAGEFLLPSGRAIDRRASSVQWGVDPTDGFYLSLSAAQVEALEAMRRDTSIVGAGSDPTRRPPVDWLASDPQTVTAVKALRTRLATGEFTRTGLPNAAMNAQHAQREEIERRRRELNAELARLKLELAELDKSSSGADDDKPKE